jgi:putative membrane protein
MSKITGFPFISVGLATTLVCATAMAAHGGAHDADFAAKAATGGMAEVEMGRLAASNASDPNIKMFGQKMVNDHSSANEELQRAAAKDGVTLPQAPSPKQKEMADKLGKLQGPEFDKEYAHMMVKDHEEDLALFKKEASSGKDPTMKAYAQKTLPTLEEHLKMAQQLDGKAGKQQ